MGWILISYIEVILFYEKDFYENRIRIHGSGSPVHRDGQRALRQLAQGERIIWRVRGQVPDSPCRMSKRKR